MTRWVRVVGVAVPGLVLAGFGLMHPAFLAPSTAAAWWQLHVWLIPLFPLLAVALGVLLRGERGVLAWGARIAAYGYATFYTCLDVLAGIGAGLVVDVQQRSSQAVNRLFDVADQLGAAGVWCFLAASVLAGIVLVRRDGVRAVPGALVLVGAGIPFLHGHIFYPEGVLAMVGIAVGCALLAGARRSEPAYREPAPQPVA